MYCTSIGILRPQHQHCQSKGKVLYGEPKTNTNHLDNYSIHALGFTRTYIITTKQVQIFPLCLQIVIVQSATHHRASNRFLERSAILFSLFFRISIRTLIFFSCSLTQQQLKNNFFFDIIELVMNACMSIAQHREFTHHFKA